MEKYYIVATVDYDSDYKNGDWLYSDELVDPTMREEALTEADEEKFNLEYVNAFKKLEDAQAYFMQVLENNIDDYRDGFAPTMALYVAEFGLKDAKVIDDAEKALNKSPINADTTEANKLLHKMYVDFKLKPLGSISTDFYNDVKNILLSGGEHYTEEELNEEILVRVNELLYAGCIY